MIPDQGTPASPLLNGLDPVTGPHPRVLILGSFPSAKSLYYSEYYGNPQNHFWKVMEALSGIGAGFPYAARIEAVKNTDIALWDIIRSCSRPGSSDAHIRREIFNDIAGFVTVHPSLRLVALNGSAAGRYYSRIAADITIPSVILPSTSPANTRFSLEEKISCWSVLKKEIR